MLRHAAQAALNFIIHFLRQSSKFRMPPSATLKHRRSSSNTSNDAMATEEEAGSILRSESRHSFQSDTSTISDTIAPKPSRPFLPPRRQSSLAKSRPPGTPRTPNRVRFDLNAEAIQDANGHVTASPSTWMELEDPLDSPGYANGHGGQRLPLLTGIEAPSVALANGYDEDFNAEDLLESARPKSSLLNAFMNMANSIM